MSPQQKSKADPTTGKQKRKYAKPQLKTESLTAVAALCNGSKTGGRKATTAAPDFCSSSRLKS